MRFSLATMSCAIALALLGGCSASQNATTLPSGSAQSVPGAAFHGNLTPLALLKLQAAGKVLGPASRPALERALKYYQTHPHQHIKVDGKGTIGMWATNIANDALLGLSASGKKTIAAIDVEDYGGYEPVAVKVDKYQNVWVANEVTEGSDLAHHARPAETFPGSNVQEYNAHGNFVDGYVWTQSCGTGTVYFCEGYGFDSAETTNSVFAGVTYFEYDSESAYDYGSGLWKFKLGDPSATPTYIPISDEDDYVNCPDNECDELGFMDADTSGNIWFDFLGYTGVSSNHNAVTSSGYAGGLGEVDKYGNVHIILPAGTLGDPRGVIVSGRGKNQVLTVVDGSTRTAYQYRLPLTSSSTPYNIIGPTKLNAFGFGEPVAGGFNVSSTKMALGDGYGWVDTCVVKTGYCKIASGPNFPPETLGAAYTPSNK